MKKRSAIAALAAFTMIAPFAAAFGVGLPATCRYYCHIKDGSFGWYASYGSDWGGPSSATTLYAYKIVRDAEGNPTGLGADVTNARYPQNSLGSTGYNYILEVVVTSESSSDSYAVPGEQLALVVKSGNTELWRSYTALPPCAWGSVAVDGFEASGMIDANYYDNDGDGLCDDYVAAYDGYFGVTLNGASEDLDGDGLTNGQEFMLGTDPSGGDAADYFPVDTITLKNWSVLDETARKATVTIDGMDTHAYSIRYTTDLDKTGKTIAFATSNGDSESTKYIYHDGDSDPGAFSQQVWFTLPDPGEVGAYYVGIAIDGVMAAYTPVAAPAATSYTITWLDCDGSEIGTSEVEEGVVPEHDDPVKADEGVYSYQFTGWTPAIEAAVADATYTATYRKVVDLSKLSGDYTAVDGDVLINATTHSVTISAGASVTVNGIAIQGAGGGAAETPVFPVGGKAPTVEFAKGEGDMWTVTAFAELEGETAVAENRIKVRRADSPEELETAEPMAEGVTFKKRTSAVMVTLEVEAPKDVEKQFFRVDFGE